MGAPRAGARITGWCANPFSHPFSTGITSPVSGRTEKGFSVEPMFALAGWTGRRYHSHMVRNRKTTRYHLPVLIEQDEDGVFIVSIPTLRGCRS